MTFVLRERESLRVGSQFPELSDLRLRFAWEARTAFVEEFCPLGAVALDLGCANGEWTLPLATRANQVDALDIVPEPLEVLERSAQEVGMSNIRTICTALPQWSSQAAQRYDFCLCMGMIMLLGKAQRIELLQSLHRVMKDKGEVFVDFYTPRYFAYRILIQRLKFKERFRSLASVFRKATSGDLLTSSVFEAEAEFAGFQVRSLSELSQSPRTAYSVGRAIEQNCFSTVIGPYYQQYLLTK